MSTSHVPPASSSSSSSPSPQPPPPPLPPPGSVPLTPPPPHANALHVSTRSVVDRDGAFHQDRVLKSGWLCKRTRKTKGWKRRWFVLRADRLSCYKDQKEYKIHRQIFLADVTAVAPLRDPKQPYSFGVFSQSKNFHFKADTEPDTADWTEKIWAAVAKEVPVEGMMLSSPVTPALAGALSPPPPPPPPPPSLLPIGASAGAGSGAGAGIPAGCRRASAQTLDYSGPDVGSVSSLSDVAGISQLSLSHQDAAQAQAAQAAQAAAEAADLPRPIARNGSGFSSTEHLPRVVWHGYMYCLKSKGAVKQWKKYWIVVRNINIAFYKNKEEYRAIKIFPLDSIVDAVEIDPVSKSKKHCLQIITDAKAYRLAAPDEDVLVKALGAMKSALARSKGPLVPPALPAAEE